VGCIVEQTLTLGRIDQPAVDDDGSNARHVANVGQRIGVEKHEVGDLPGGHGAQ